jgi:uncharacterized protein DUF4351
MHNPSDQFVKNILRDALSLACAAETEVEVLAATQKIDVYTVPDPARAAERVQLGLLGELSAEPSLFEPFHDTPSLRKVRRYINKQHTWHHELERRARPVAGSPPAVDTGPEASVQEAVRFPALVVIGPGRPETVLDAYGCKPVGQGVYHAVWGLVLRVIVLAELPRTRETLLLRLLGAKRVLREALADLAALPDDAREKTIATPLLVHFRLGHHEHEDQEDDVSAEIRAWFEDYQQKQRNERNQAITEACNEARNEEARRLLLRQLHVRFGELPAAAVAHIAAADISDLELWSERVLNAKTLAEVLDDVR